MYRDELDKMILSTSKASLSETDEEKKASLKTKVAVYRLIKAEYLKHKTAKNATPLDDAVEVNILRKMAKQREDSIAEYLKAGRQDLVDNETKELNVIKEMLPAEITAEQIETTVKTLISTIEPIKKNMGLIIKGVKEVYPTADGKLVSSIVIKFLS
jgi:hypothetical protein